MSTMNKGTTNKRTKKVAAATTGRGTRISDRSPRPTASVQSARERRAAEDELRALIDRLTPDHQRLVGVMRRTLCTRLRGAHEIVYDYRDALVLSFSPSGHGSEGVLAIRAGAEGVRLYFNQGKQLADPLNLLKGSGGMVRYVQVKNASMLARPEVRALIGEAIARSRMDVARGGQGSLTVRMTTARKRRLRPTPRGTTASNKSG
jgi:hypothetical protein